MQNHTPRSVKALLCSAALGVDLSLRSAAGACPSGRGLPGRAVSRASFRGAARRRPRPPRPRCRRPVEPAPGYPYGPPPPRLLPPLTVIGQCPTPIAPAARRSSRWRGSAPTTVSTCAYTSASAATGFSSTQAGIKTNYAGGGSSTGIAIGGVIARDLILYGAAFGTEHLESQTSRSPAPASRATSADIGVGAIGRASPTTSSTSTSTRRRRSAWRGSRPNDGDGFRADSSRSGTAFELMLGKEWWVSPDWGLGIAGELFTASLKDKNMPGLTWSAAPHRFSSRRPTTDARSAPLTNRRCSRAVSAGRARAAARCSVGLLRGLWTVATRCSDTSPGSRQRPAPAAGGRPAAVGWLYPIRAGLGLDWVGAVTIGHAILASARACSTGRRPARGSRSRTSWPTRASTMARAALPAAAHPGAGGERTADARQAGHGQPRPRLQPARADAGSRSRSSAPHAPGASDDQSGRGAGRVRRFG